MENNGIKIIVPVEFGTTVKALIRDVLNLAPICVDGKDMPGKFQMWYSVGGDLNALICEIYTRVQASVKADFSVSRF
jgi:hypothetical protein